MPAALILASAILFISGGIFISSQSANAVPIAPAAMKEGASATSTVQQAQFYGHRSRHHVVKCYRELVVGSYVCRRFHRWW
jgi:hypothetical protein